MHTRSMFSFARMIVALASLACGVAAGMPTADTAPSAAAGSRGQELARLVALAGRWTVRQSLWTDPTKPPAIDVGAATFTAVLDGRHLRQDLRIDAPAKPFEGLGYLGYDDATGRYDSLWMDVNFGGMIVAHGSYDPARQAYTFTAAVPDAKHGGTMRPLREVMRVKDADHFTFEYYERRGGGETLAVRLEYARMK